MSAVPRLAPANAVLLLLALGLAGMLVQDLGRPLWERPADRPAAASAIADAATEGKPGIEQFRAAVERPLFAPSRRPASQAVPMVSAAPPAPLPNLELVGILAAGEDVFILVRPPGGRVQRLAVGQAIGEWRLDSIGPDRADFMRDGARATLPLMRRALAQPMPVSEPWLAPSPTGSGH